MEIIEFNNSYKQDVKNLLVELQEHIVQIDSLGLNIISDDYPEKYFEKTLNETSNNKGKIFLAKNQNEIIGMIACFVYPYNEDDKLDYTCPTKGIVSELVVSSNNRQSGVGNALISHAETYLKNIGCEYVQLELFCENICAKNFYAKHGYQERCVILSKKLN